MEQFDTLRRKHIRVIRYKGTNKINTIEEKIGRKGYAVGFEKLIGYLKPLPHSEIIKQSLREEVAVFPEIALRELFQGADNFFVRMGSRERRRRYAKKALIRKARLQSVVLHLSTQTNRTALRLVYHLKHFRLYEVSRETPFQFS